MSHTRLVTYFLAASLAAAESRMSPAPEQLGPQQQLVLVTAACPGKTSAGPAGIVCSACPTKGTADPGEWRAGSIYTGHFLSPSTESAIVSAPGCKEKSSYPGATIVLEKKSGNWRRLTVHTGPGVEECAALRAKDGHDLLLCLADQHRKRRVSGSGTLMDVTETVLYALDYGKETSSEVFNVASTPGTVCTYGFEWESHIEAVQFGVPSADGSRVVSISYSKGESTREGAREGCEANPPKPILKHLEEQFVFDGQLFERQ